MAKLSSIKVKQLIKGFTLIEVVVALAVLAISLSAVTITSTELIHQIQSLQSKTTATWVASNTMNKARVGLIDIPFAPLTLTGKSQMLNQTWKWTLKAKALSETQRQITVSVTDMQQETSVELMGFSEVVPL